MPVRGRTRGARAARANHTRVGLKGQCRPVVVRWVVKQGGGGGSCGDYVRRDPRQRRRPWWCRPRSSLRGQGDHQPHASTTAGWCDAQRGCCPRLGGEWPPRQDVWAKHGAVVDPGVPSTKAGHGVAQSGDRAGGGPMQQGDAPRDPRGEATRNPGLSLPEWTDGEAHQGPRHASYGVASLYAQSSGKPSRPPQTSRKP